ncbi:MAG: hypothetical protein JW928_06955 [Candidatus Aureabacteria bacterium]|nr:hypothetical protein [Candidatus Auribacterota bacterium]
MENNMYSEPAHQENRDPYRTKSLFSFWLGISCILLIVILMIAATVVGGTGTFEEGYQRGQALGAVWGLYVIGSMVASFILSIIAIIMGSLSAKKDNVRYRIFAVLGIVFGAIGLSLFICCSVLVVLGIMAALSKGL